MQALKEALRTLLGDPVAMGLLIAGIVVIVGYHGLRWQERIEKEKSASHRA